MSYIFDPPGPVGRIGGHYFHTWCPSVRPSARPSQKQTCSNVNIGARKIKYSLQRTPCVKITTTKIGRGMVGHLKFAKLVPHIFGYHTCLSFKTFWVFLAIANSPLLASNFWPAWIFLAKLWEKEVKGPKQPGIHKQNYHWDPSMNNFFIILPGLAQSKMHQSSSYLFCSGVPVKPIRLLQFSIFNAFVT